MTAEVAVRDHTALLTELECNSSIDEFATVRVRAAELRTLAAEAGDDEAVHRCDMLIADVLLREGQLGPGGLSAHQTQAWAEQHGRPYVQARAHRVLSNFYRLLGDFPEALAHGVQGVSNLPADAPPAVRARHLIMLGCALDDNGSFDEGELRYREVLRIAGELGDDGLTLRALNNMAYNAYEAGNEPTASTLATRMREVAARGRPLAAKELDTIARVEMMAGRYAELETTLAGALDGTILDTDGDGAAECLLTLASARRDAGRPAAAQAALDRAVQLCERNGLSRVRVQVQREQAALFAAAGKYQDAYEELLRHNAGQATLQSNQREARARAMQAVFEANEFREMAHRDALTGVYNRWYVNEQLPVLLAEVASNGEPLSVAILDLDHFKQVNDTFSHATGDAVLQQVARLLPDGTGRSSLPDGTGGSLLPDGTGGSLLPDGTGRSLLPGVSGDRMLHDGRAVADGPAVAGGPRGPMVADGTGGPAVAARLGGEEFLLILPGFDAPTAARYCERLRLEIHNFPWAAITGPLSVTASIGVTTTTDGHSTVPALLAAADRNLYAAKRAGRDRVVS